MEELYIFWKSNTNLWFNSTKEDDKLITEKYFLYLEKYKKYEIVNKLELTAYIILYDQILRHINRHLNENYTHPDDFINECYMYYEIYKDFLDDFEFMFILMPLRHTHELHHIKFVLNEIWNRNITVSIKKYLVATYERYIKCGIKNDHLNIKKYIEYEGDFDDSILDNQSFLSETFNNNLVSLMKDFINNNNLTNKTIIISISGGVDSMVCSYLLKLIEHPFIAVHIDYYNRDECLKEEDLLKWWCCKILNIPLYIRRIDEINRPKCMKNELRDLYESYTKSIRFNTYKIIDNPIVMLGHNKDDTLENILTNTAHMSHYDNLLGMDYVSIIDEITFIRPLLNTFKKEIYSFANKNNIPFLIDSTPKWSQRGKIRDIVRPALESWNPLILDGFLALSEKMKQMSLLIDKLISKQINYDNIESVPNDSLYWSIVLKKNNIYITQKTLKELINKIKYFQCNSHKLKELKKFTLCKSYHMEFLQKDRLYISLIKTI
jgi:tRNA(Ile)-lysidine synthetase-like protein